MSRQNMKSGWAVKTWWKVMIKTITEKMFVWIFIANNLYKWFISGTEVIKKASTWTYLQKCFDSINKEKIHFKQQGDERKHIHEIQMKRKSKGRSVICFEIDFIIRKMKRGRSFEIFMIVEVFRLSFTSI